MDESSTYEQSTSEIVYVEEKNSKNASPTLAIPANSSPTHVRPVKKHVIQSNANFDGALEKFILAVTSKPENDEYTLFAQSVALQLQKLPEVHSLNFMMTVQKQLTDLRIQILNSESNKKTSVLPSIGLPRKRKAVKPETII